MNDSYAVSSYVEEWNLCEVKFVNALWINSALNGVENINGNSISPSFVPFIVNAVVFIILQPLKYLAWWL